MSRSAVLSIAMALSLSSVAPVSAAGPSVTVVRETRVSTAPTSASTRSREPILATDPMDGSRIAVTYAKGGTSTTVVIRISHDSGRTFTTAVGHPRGSGSHPAIAWGPGPGGSARLYYMGMTTYAGRCCYFAISHSDNEGRTWSSPYVAHDTRPWSGGFPDLAVDTDTRSPNYGTVYAAYNWPANASKGPGLRLLASSDYGRTFHGIEVPVARTPANFGDTWRIDYRVRAAADGSAYVAFYQRDLRTWNSKSPFSSGGWSNVGRIGFSVARFVYHRSTGTFSLGPTVMAARLPKTSWDLGGGSPVAGLTDPMWCFGFDVAPDTGALYLAVSVNGGIRVYESTDRGRTWTYRSLPAAAPVAGRSQWTFRPNLVAGRGFLIVTLHTLDRTGSARTVGNDLAVSFDAGRSWSRPARITASRWRTDDFASTLDGIGLHERAALTADGSHVFFAYGDGRLAAGGHHGFGAVYGALLSIRAE